MNRWTKRDHARAAFVTCPKPCIGGRMTWQWAEPQWQTELGLVGVCTHCGVQVFTADILNEVIINQPTPQTRQRRSGPSRKGFAGRGGWTRNHSLFEKTA